MTNLALSVLVQRDAAAIGSPVLSHSFLPAFPLAVPKALDITTLQVNIPVVPLAVPQAVDIITFQVNVPAVPGLGPAYLVNIQPSCSFY